MIFGFREGWYPERYGGEEEGEEGEEGEEEGEEGEEEGLVLEYSSSWMNCYTTSAQQQNVETRHGTI